MIIDAPVLTEPRTWRVSKVNRISANKGAIVVTLAQNLFNEHTDYIETDDSGNVIGMWASYYTNNGTEPTKSETISMDSESTLSNPSIRSEITFSGANPQIKVGGSYKKLTVRFYDDTGELKYKNGAWSFEINGVDVSDLVTTLSPNDSSDLDSNQIKVKFTGDDSYIGETLDIYHTSGTNMRTHLAMDIVGL